MNKGSIFILIIITSTVTSWTDPCPEEDIKRTGCQGPEDCLYPNPYDCNAYIQCVVNDDGKTGTPVNMPCLQGLEWNDNIKSCDWPESSTCNKIPPPPSDSTPGELTDGSNNGQAIAKNEGPGHSRVYLKMK